MSDNNSPTVTNSSTPSSSDRPASNSFWSTIDHIIRPQVSIRSPTVTSSTPTTAAATSSTNFATTDNNFTQAEKFNQRLNDLKSSDSVQNRLKIFDDLIKLSEVSILNESLINNLLESTRDLYLIEKTAIEFRKQAFENLTHIYQKQSEKFESLVNKNHLLIILIANLTNLTSSDSLFLSVFEPMLKNVQTKTGDTLPSACDDIRQRFALFMHMTKNGTCCKNLDPVMANECLKIFIRYSSGLDTKLFYDIIKNLLHNKYFNLFNDTLFLQISKNILDFSYNLLKQTDNLNQLNKNQIIELKSCIDLCEKLSPNLITIESVSYMIIVLCELIALNAQKNSTDTQLMLQIYEILSNLLSGSIGHASLFSFFTQIFPSHGKLQKFRQQQVNGALLHIRQLFDDFKQSKLKSTFLIKEIHLNCLVYLPIALKSCSNEPTQQQQQNLILFENILSLTLDLVQLATHRDLFMCLLTFNSRKFLIEIIEQISSQIAQTDNKKLIQPYAELLNLLDKKDVFNYKTSSSTGAVGGSGGNINSSNSISTSNVPTTSNATDDGNAVVLQKFKDNFHTLVYNFPHISYLNDSCINNCIDYYLGRKLLPTHGKNSIHGIKQLIERYFLIKQNKPIKLEIRKNILELACKKLFDYNRIEYKTFIDDVIQQAILPCIERSISEDNIYYHGFDNDPVNLVQMHSELVEIKSFVVNKLIELSSLCHYEENILKIVGIYQQIIHLEKTNSIDQLSIQNQAISTTNVANKSPANLTSIIVTPSINSQNYLNRIINALIDLFERHHFNSSHCMTRSCAKIYCILTSYLHTYYEAFCNKPSSLSTIAADTLTFQHQQQQQQQPQSQQGHQHRNSISLSMDHNLKYFNYYAQLRRDVFDFLFRIRSDFQNRVQLLNRNDRKKHSDSKYLILALKKNIELIEDCTNKCVLDYGKFLDVIEECLDKVKK